MIGDTSAESPWKFRGLVILAALLWSLSGLFVKSPLLRDIPVEIRGPMLACYRALAAGIVLFPFVNRSAIRWRPGLIPLVLSFSVMNILFVTSMTMTSAAAAIFLQYTATAWVALLSWLILRERLERSMLLPLIGALAGITWIVAAEQVPAQALGNVIALGSGLTYGVLLVLLRLLKDENSAWLTALNHLAAGLLLLPWVITFDVALSPAQGTLIILLGVIQMGVPYALFAYSVKHISATEAVLISLMEPLLNPLWVWLFWGEAIDRSIVIGGSLILGGLLARVLLLSRKRAAPAVPD